MSVLYIKGKDGKFVPIFTVKGADGSNGIDGAGIEDIKYKRSEGLVDTYEITYTDERQPTYFTVTNGEAGTDGVSPTVTVEEIDGGHSVTITDASGDKPFDVLDGKDGKDGISVKHRWEGTKLYITSANGTSSADLKGEKGDTGKGFRISKTYKSIAEMQDGHATDGVPLYGFVLIDAENGVNDEDNAKLYVKGEKGYEYLTDLSGAQGIQGVGIQSIEKTASNGVVDTYTITYTDGNKTTFTVINGTDGETPKITIGDNGNWYINGKDKGVKAQGEDGFSPIVTITEIPDGNRVTITDKTGAHEFDVLNGNGGGVGTFEVIIEVEELPTENIDNNKIYIVNKSSKTEVYFHYGTGYVTLSQLIYGNFKVSPTITYYVVDILPSNPLTSDLATFSSIYCYIYNNIPYVYGNAGQGDNWIKVSDLVSLNSQTQIVDNGRTYNIGQESIAGIYAYYEDKKFYLYSNNKWVEINKNNYILMLNGTNGTLTDEQYQNLVDKFPNVTLIVKQRLGEAGQGYCTIPVIAKNNLADGVIVYAASYTNGTIQSSLMIWSDKTWAIEEEDFSNNFFALNKNQSVYGETEFYATQTFYGDAIFGNNSSLIGKGLSISFSQSTISSEFDLDITASGYLSLYSTGGLSIYSDDEVTISGASTSMQTVDGLNAIAINEFGRIDITSIEGVYVSAQDKFQVNAKSMSFTNLGGTATVNIAEDGTVTVAGGKAVHIISGTGTNSSSVSFTKDGIDIYDGIIKIDDKDVATEEYVDNIGAGLDKRISTVGSSATSYTNEQIAEVWKKIYPVGAIYISTNSTSPASLFGGTWTQITDKFLLSAGSRYLAGSTGGSATHTHTISGYAHITGGSRASGGYAIMQDSIGSNVSYTKKRETTASSINVNYSPTTETVYTGTPITATNTSESNIPPYLVVYMWKRTA